MPQRLCFEGQGWGLMSSQGDTCTVSYNARSKAEWNESQGREHRPGAAAGTQREKRFILTRKLQEGAHGAAHGVSEIMEESYN